MASETLALLSGATSTVTGSTLQIAEIAGRESVPYAVFGITTATVVIEGSLDGTSFSALVTVTTDQGGLVPAFPFMRARVSAYTSGDITAQIHADKVFGT